MIALQKEILKMKIGWFSKKNIEPAIETAKPERIEMRAYPTSERSVIPNAAISENRGNSALSLVDYLQTMGHQRMSFAQMLSYYDLCAPLADAVDLVADGVASIQPVVWDRVTEDYVDHPVLELLETPNDAMDYSDFANDAVHIQMLTNNPFLNLVGPVTQPPLALDIIRPQHTEITPDRTGDIDYIRVSSDFINAAYKNEFDGGRARYREEKDGEGEIWPMWGFNPNKGTRNFYASSQMQPLFNEIEQYIMGNKHNRALLANGARPGGVFATEGGSEPLTDRQQERMQDEIQKNYQGVDNAGVPMLLEWVKYHDMLVNNRDMDYVNLQADARNGISKRWKIPLAMIDAKAMTYSNFGQATIALFNMAVLPAANFFYRQLKAALMYRYGNDWKRYDITYNPSNIPALQTEMVENSKKRSEVGIYTVNELRETAGLGAIDNGDVILRPANDVPALDYGEDDYEDDDKNDGENADFKRNNESKKKDELNN